MDVEDLETETPHRRLRGWAGRLASILSIGLSLYALYWVLGIIEPQLYRLTFLLVVLVSTFLLYAARRIGSTRITIVDGLLILLSVVALGWPILDLNAFIYRAATPSTLDLVLGVVTIGLVLEATRRTTGWILPCTALGFIAYAYYGPLLEFVGLGLVAHRGYDVARIVGTLYMSLEGIFGVPLDVAATYIVLFTLYGAILEASGAGRFFIDWALAAVGRSGDGVGAGRTVPIAGFLLGTVSGSGVASTVTLGAVAWPMLKRAGYPPEMAGAMLAGAGIGAILSPPTLGAAAFIIAEFLRISYLHVVVMATVPAILYYLSIFLMIEADARRVGVVPVKVEMPSVWQLTRSSGYHFAALIVIPLLLLWGMTAFRAVFFAMLLAVALSFLRKDTALWPRRLLSALEVGGRGVLSIAATTATAGIIVGVVTLTGLGLKIAGVIVALAGGSLVLTVVFSAVAVMVLGLAVPVTASYIIAAVMIAPALTQVGVSDLAAHMFIFYYAVLSEVSPPTALAPFAAAALTGGKPIRTMMLTWKYTLPAFVVPFAFTLSPEGMGVLLQAPIRDILWTTTTSALGVVALAGGLGGWALGTPMRPLARVLATISGLLLFYASYTTDAIGVVLLGAAVGVHVARNRR